MNRKWTMRSLRKANDVTQAEIANKLGVSTNQYRKYESSKVIPSVEFAMEFASYFGEDINNIIFFNTKVSKTKQTEAKEN